LDRIF
jgi:hypothetical protein